MYVGNHRILSRRPCLQVYITSTHVGKQRIMPRRLSLQVYIQIKCWEPKTHVKNYLYRCTSKYTCWEPDNHVETNMITGVHKKITCGEFHKYEIPHIKEDYLSRYTYKYACWEHTNEWMGRLRFVCCVRAYVCVCVRLCV